MNPPRPTTRMKLLYGLGQGAEGIKSAAFSVFLIFYYNQVLGLSGSLSGLAVGIALVFDAIADPFVGSLSDRWQSARGRRHPFMYAAVLPFSIAMFLLFSPPHGLSELSLFAWLTLFGVLTRCSMTLFNVPHIALGAELSSDFDERTTIVSHRFFFGTLGTFVALSLGFGVFLADTNGVNGLFDPGRYSGLAGTLSLLMFFVMIASAVGTQRFSARLYQPQAGPPGRPLLDLMRQLMRDLRGVLRNSSFRALFLGLLATAVMIGVDNSLSLHMNSFFWELSSKQNMPFFIAGPVGLMIGVLLTRKLGARFDKKPLILWGTGGWLLCQITPVILRSFDCFPVNGTPGLVWALVAFKALQGVILAQIIVPFHSMVADIVDEHQLESGERNEGIFFAAVGFSGKATSGLGSFASGLALDLISWPRGSAVLTASDVPPETISALGFVYGPGIATFGIVSIWLYSHHNLNRSRHLEIQAELKKRQLASDAESS